MILSLCENMKKIILINIILLTFLVYIFSAYNHRKFIVNNQLPIKDFSVLAVNCSSGFRGGSTIQILYDKKSYYVGISTKQCKLLDFNDISLYYDKENDEIFKTGNGDVATGKDLVGTLLATLTNQPVTIN